MGLKATTIRDMIKVLSLGIFIQILLLKCEIAVAKNVTIGTIELNGGILPYEYRRSGPAVDIALEQIRVKYSSVFNITYLYSDPGSKCTESGFGALSAEMYYKHNVDVFIGPGCSLGLNVIGKLAASWNLPVITGGGTDSNLANKMDFPTLTRLSFDFNKFRKMYVSLLRKFNWTYVTIIHDIRSYFFLIVGDSLLDEFRMTGINVERFTFDSFAASQKADITKCLENASHRSRVIVVICSGDSFREMMLIAHKLGMTNGEYVFIVVSVFPGDGLGDFRWKRLDNLDQIAAQAYDAVLMVRPKRPTSAKFLKFEQEVKMRSSRDYNFTFGDVQVNPFIISLYEAFMIYAAVVNETIIEDGNLRDGRKLVTKIWNKEFESIDGPMKIDNNGDRIIDFSLLDLDGISNEYMVIADYIGYEMKLVFDNSPHWPNNKGPPLNKPLCGFTGDNPACHTNELSTTTILGIVLGNLVVVFLLVLLFLHRKYKYENDVRSNWWRIRKEDLVFKNLSRSALSKSSDLQSPDEYSTTSKEEGYLSNIGLLKGRQVFMRAITARNINIDRNIIVEMIQMRDMSNNNLTKFIGLCIKDQSIVIVTENCSRGSLQEFLLYNTINLDKDWKVSIIQDVLQGMSYLHQSSIAVHGNLTSYSCFIDSRFVLKVSDFGLRRLRNQCNLRNKFNPDNCFWTAPEHLRCTGNTCSQDGDLYSFGIILYEIITRNKPFAEELDYLASEEILKRVVNKEDPPFRPTISQAAIDSTIGNIKFIMDDCLREEPGTRPHFTAIGKRIKETNGISGNLNILDSLLRRMEQYATNLEAIVQERTEAFLEEKRKSEELLYQVLPRSVAVNLRNGHPVDPEAYNCVTIYFSDIVGFTTLSAESTPFQIVDLLNDLYSCFDEIIENYDVYKVETIGDSYMVVSGLPIRNGTEHVREIAKMALSIRDSVKVFRIRHRPEVSMKCRIGIHSGSVCAGVVGRKMPRYCLFGDTVNTASRMESNGEAMKIHISEASKTLLDKDIEFRITRRGTINIKGKGLMTTYWLNKCRSDDEDDFELDSTKYNTF